MNTLLNLQLLKNDIILINLKLICFILDIKLHSLADGKHPNKENVQCF